VNALLLLGLLVGADKPKDEAKLDGTWVVVSMLKEGKQDDDIKGDKVTFKDGKLNVKNPDKNKDEQGTYKLDASAKPKTIDIMPAGSDKAIVGIYKVEGDKLIVCGSHEPGGTRPTEFSSKEGSGLMLVELKREKK